MNLNQKEVEKIFKAAQKSWFNDDAAADEEMRMWFDLRIRFAEAFKSKNENFDAEKFEENCK